MGDAVHVRYCRVADGDDEDDYDDPPHPCDPPRPCDPFKDVEGDCPMPYICFERLKNPALGNNKCMEGAYINAKECGKGAKGGKIPPSKEPHHPCDPLPPCSTKKKKRPCREPTLCYHRIKNPEWPRKPITSDCNPDL